MNKEISIIGVGNMGQAVTRGLLETKTFDRENLLLANCSIDKLRPFQEIGIAVATQNTAAALACDILILAVKPQAIHTVLSEIRDVVAGDKLVISLAAGVSLDSIRAGLAIEQPVVRVMPNLGAQKRQSMSVWVRNENVTEAQAKDTREILRSIGEEMELDGEDDINRATAISGSGPAYIFYLVELLEQSAQGLGFDVETAAILARQTLIGSVDLLESPGKTAHELRASVTSKGGTTEAAFKEFAKGDLEGTFTNGVQAAYRRAIELGQILSNQ